MDRYSVMTEDGEVVSMSENANSPQGFNQYAGNFKELSESERRERMGDTIELREAPAEVLVAIIDRLEEYYNDN